MYAVFKESSTNGGYWIMADGNYSMDGNDALFIAQYLAEYLAEKLSIDTGEDHFVRDETYARSNPPGGPKRP